MIQIPLTQAEYETKTAELATKHDIHLQGPEGKLTKSGVTASYAYAAGLLTVTILEKPFFVSTDSCESELRKFLGA